MTNHNMSPELHTMQAIGAEVSRNVYTSPEHLELTLAATALQGSVVYAHSMPGTGKTLEVRTLARAMGGTFGRMQGDNTKDASDIVGSVTYNQGTSEYEFHEGPAFANAVLVDEAPRFPDLDGALQPMEEGTVTVEALNTVRELPAVRSFHLTGNPLANGREKLDLATRDRIWLQMPTDTQTATSYRSKLGIAFGETNKVEAVADIADIEKVYKAINEEVRVRPIDMDSAVKLWEDIMQKGKAENAFDEGQTTLAESTRPLIHLLKFAQATTFLKGEQLITPERLARLAGPVLAHRITFNREYRQNNSTKTPAILVRDAVADFLK